MSAYFPPYPVLKRTFGGDLEGASNADLIQVPVSVLKLLIRSALASAPFDAESYLANNPDLREAHEKGQIVDLKRHYIDHGYLEGRRADKRAVDEEWYLSHYKDVAVAVREGSVASAQEHYDIAGEREWRAPNSAASQQMQAWRAALLSA